MIILNNDTTKKYTIPGRGIALLINVKEYNGLVFKMNETVSYEDEEYEIKSIERNAFLTYPLTYSDDIGLITNKIKKDNNESTY